MVKADSAAHSVADLLRSRGVGVTRQRLEIAGLLFVERRHWCADQILAAVNAGGARVSKATVYNTLRLLRDRGLLAEVVVDPARVYYDPVTDPHHHVYEAASGELIDVPAEGVAVVGLPPLPPGLSAERIDIIVRARRTGK